MFNPILASSMRRRMRTVKTPLILTCYSALLALTMAFSTAIINRPTVYLQTMRGGVDAYIILLALQFILTLVVTPAMTAGCITGERERQTLELLLVTNTGSLRIVIGKLLESFAFMALLIVSTLPALGVVLVTGGVTIMNILSSMLFMLVTAFGALCVGLFCSAVFKRTVTAVVASYLGMFLIGALSLSVAYFALSRVLSGYEYDWATLVQQIRSGEISVTPIPFIVNPGIAFLCLISDQTMLLDGTINKFLPYSSYNLLRSFNMGLLAYKNMCFVLLSGCAMTLLSALFVRPKRRAAKKRA